MRAQPRGELIAWNVVDRKAVWRVPHPVAQSGGVLATAGNLVFQGRSDGTFAAYRAGDGAPLWSFDAGTGVMAAPATYLVNGVQYVTVMVGWGGTQALANPRNHGPMKPGFGRILTFAVGGKAALVPTPYGHAAPPMPAIALDTTPAALLEGQMLYRTYCRFCHGLDAIAGPTPDLRYATADVHRQFDRRAHSPPPSSEARAIVQRLLATEGGYVPPTHLAMAYAAVQDTDGAMDLLERAYDERDPHLYHVNGFNPAFTRMRTEPRFVALVEKMGLA